MVSDARQVRFFFETFRRLRPGVSLMMLHSHMKQGRRSAVYSAFCDAEKGLSPLPLF
jgi:ATP-dependent RNA helicase DDX10/DBP4